MAQTANDGALHVDTSLPLDPVAAAETDEMQVSPSVPSAVVSVFTDRSFLSCIGSFQPDPLAFLPAYKLKMLGRKKAKQDGPVGSLVDEAVARDDLDGLKMIYSACRLDMKAADKPELSFENAVNVAAAKGRLTVLQWLYVRSQQRPVNTTADNLSRLCQQQLLGGFTDKTMVCAARAGRLEAVKLLRSFQGLELSTREAMDVAIECGHVSIVKYFREECGEGIDERRLSISLRSTAGCGDKMVELLWTQGDEDIEARRRVARGSFKEICGRWPIRIINMIVPFVAQDAPTLLSGLRAAVDRVNVSIVSTLLPLCVGGSLDAALLHNELLRLLQLALERESAPIASMLMEAGKFSPPALATTFRSVVQEVPYKDLSVLVDLHLDKFCDDALAVAAQASAMKLLKRLHPTRTKTIAIEALRVAENVETAEFLLVNESEFYSERVVLENAPPCIEPKLMRLFLQDGHQEDLDTIASFAHVEFLPPTFLEPHEVKSIQEADDPVLNARLVARHTNLLSPSFMSTIVSAGAFDLVDFLHNKLGLTQLTTKRLNRLIERGLLDDVKSLFDIGVRDVYMGTMKKILREDPNNIVHFLFDQRDAKIDARFVDVLADALQITRGDGESASDHARRCEHDPFSWTMSLLQLLVQQRPELHSRLLDVVAGAGSMEAVSYMLSPRSGVDTSKVLIVPAIVAAARGGHKKVVELLLSVKRDEEVIDLVSVRELLSSVGDAGGLQLLLGLLAQRDPSVQEQLNKEREAASAMFGFVSTTRDTTTKRKTTGRAKRK